MAETSRDAKPTKPDNENKQPETVLLTAEELRAIAGGAVAGKPPVASNDIISHPAGPKKP
jgi:hypothetical protein